MTPPEPTPKPETAAGPDGVSGAERSGPAPAPAPTSPPPPPPPPPPIGKPTPPPQALTVAISDRFAPSVRSARLRQFGLHALGIGCVVGEDEVVGVTPLL